MVQPGNKRISYLPTENERGAGTRIGREGGEKDACSSDGSCLLLINLWLPGTCAPSRLKAALCQESGVNATERLLFTPRQNNKATGGRGGKEVRSWAGRGVFLGKGIEGKDPKVAVDLPS